MMDLASLREAVRAGTAFEYLHFYGHTARGPSLGSECLSQWYPAAFEVDGDEYPTAEHWMMAGKARLFGDAEALQQILHADDPATAKRWGRQVRGFSDERWAARRSDLVVEGNLAKFSQHDALRRYLLGTGERVLVEAAPRDRIWGIGMGASNPAASDPSAWRGQNLLGFALMEVRRRLR